MLSALIPSQLSYSAMLLAEQPIHQRLVHSGPLVTCSLRSQHNANLQIVCKYRKYTNATSSHVTMGVDYILTLLNIS